MISHCKEHLFEFANMYYPRDKNQSEQWVDSCIDLLMEGKVKELLIIISRMPVSQKQVEKEKQKLYNYLQNNETRINYGGL